MKKLIRQIFLYLLRAEVREITTCDEQGNTITLRVLVLPEVSR